MHLIYHRNINKHAHNFYFIRLVTHNQKKSCTEMSIARLDSGSKKIILNRLKKLLTSSPPRSKTITETTIGEKKNSQNFIHTHDLINSFFFKKI